MPITALGPRGTGTDKSTGRTCSMSPSQDIPAGSLLILWYANDNIFNVGIPTDGANFFTCSDTAGNVWSTIGSATDTACFFRCGSLAQLYGCQLRYPLTTSDTITVSSANHDAGSVWAKAMSLEEFDIGFGQRWCLPSNTWTKLINRGADPGAISRTMDGGLREVLFVHALASEGPNTDTYTWDADYTQIVSAGTTGGAATSNMQILGGYRIVTQLSDTVNVQSDTADRNYAQTMNVISAARKTVFPTTPILDDFNRADETPLDNGTWIAVTREAYFGAFLDLVSNEAAGTGGSWWEDSWTDCGEAYVTMTQFDATGHSVHFYGQGDSSDGTLFASGASWVRTYGMDSDVIFFGRSDPHGAASISGAGNQIGTPVCYAQVNGVDGCKLGLQRIRTSWATNGADHLWIDRGVGEGWEEVVGRVHAFDATFEPNTGQAAISCHGSSGRLDDFGGGEIECLILKPQIMRYR